MSMILVGASLARDSFCPFAPYTLWSGTRLSLSKGREQGSLLHVRMDI
jgi:hypothetical protein